MPTPKDLVRFLKRRGFAERRQRGSHLVLQHPTNHYRVVIPMHSRDLPTGLFRRILQDAGFSLDEFPRG